MWTEYLNRLLGVTVGFLILATLVVAIRDHRHTRRILWPSALAFLLVGFEGWLGGVVVKEELAAWLVTAHLVVALVIVSLLLYATVFAFFRDTAPAPLVSAKRRALATWTLILIAVTLLQVGLGTQVRGAVDEAMRLGGSRFTALASAGAFDRWHRDTAVVVFGLVLLIAVQIGRKERREPTLVRAAFALAILVAVQIALGLTLAYMGLTPATQIAHLSGASLLLGAETVLLLLVRWLPL